MRCATAVDARSVLNTANNHDDLAHLGASTL
jgi:hypothetical protein